MWEWVVNFWNTNNDLHASIVSGGLSDTTLLTATVSVAELLWQLRRPQIAPSKCRRASHSATTRNR